MFPAALISVRIASSIELRPGVGVSETDKEIEVTAELPGLDEKDVQVELANGVLAIAGEKKTEIEDKERSVIVSTPFLNAADRLASSTSSTGMHRLGRGRGLIVKPDE